MNRLERLSAILIKLQSRTVVTAQQIAEQFEVCLRTIYRDIKTLEEAGIPIVGNVGIGYSLVDGFKLPPLMFSRDEAVAFLTAEKFIEKMTDLHNVRSYKSGMDKIKSVLRYVEKDYITDIENNIKVMGRQDITTELPKAVTQCILQSISEKKIMQISYQKSEQNLSEREIEPIGCFYSQTNWYLIAFCKLRNEYRNFRIDKILNFNILSEHFSKEHLSLSEYMDKHKFDSQLYEVILSIKTSNINTMEGHRFYHGWLKDEIEGDYTNIHFRIWDLDHFTRWYISFSDVATIKQPNILKDRFQELMRKIKVANNIDTINRSEILRPE